MWSVRRVPVTRRAAAFWTDCSRWSWPSCNAVQQGIAVVEAAADKGVNQRIRQCGVIGVQALRPAGTRSCLRYGELPTVNLVRVAYVLTVINTIYFSTWLHKHKLCLIKFWNSDRNRNALREMFSCLQQSLGRHQASLFDLDMLNFVQTNRMIILVLLYFEWKLSKTRASLSNTMQFWVIDDLCKLGKEYLTALKCKLCTSF